MSNYPRDTVPAKSPQAKGTNLAREIFTSNFWMSGLAMLKYIPRSFRVKQVDGMGFYTDAKHDEFRNSGAEDAGAKLRALGGADAILATAPSGKAMSGLINGLATRGKLLVIGLAPDPLEVNTGSLVFGMRSISGSTTGSVQDEQETLEFSLLESVEPMIEVMPLSKAREAYDRMMAAKARFRVVLSMNGSPASN
jgi:D-arabinose 1-dehydrogenase-like Zn-dependent alcohol dehydrogenase